MPDFEDWRPAGQSWYTPLGEGLGARVPKPVLAYLMSQQAAPLDLLPTDIADEPLAWMVRRDDTALRQVLNDALATMRRDGALDRVLERWIPQVERVRSR